MTNYRLVRAGDLQTGDRFALPEHTDTRFWLWLPAIAIQRHTRLTGRPGVISVTTRVPGMDPLDLLVSTKVAVATTPLRVVG